MDKMQIPEEIESESPDMDEGDEIKRSLDRIIKSNREIIILSLLEEMPMCGYDIIKEVFTRYNVFLSQGTVYSILYSLEERGVLRAEFSRGNMRTKKYSITPSGRELVQKRIFGFAQAMEQVLILMKR